MPELRVVAVSNDGSRLVLKAADSTEYSLPIDERLRAAVRGDRPRLGQIEIEVESHLRPRDIQARIRAGASAEEVAQLAGISVERVRRFEGPVLAERAFMAERARKTSVRRHGESTGPQLGDAVAERLLLRGAEKDSDSWDSWRRDDGTWEIVLLLPGRRPAAAGELDVRPAAPAGAAAGRRGARADRREPAAGRGGADLPVRAEDRPASRSGPRHGHAPDGPGTSAEPRGRARRRVGPDGRRPARPGPDRSRPAHR